MKKNISIFMIFVLAMCSFFGLAKADNEPVATYMNEAMWSTYDIGKPQVATELFKRYGYEGTNFLGLMRTLSREEPVANDTFYAYEDNRFIDDIVVLADVADPGVGNDISFVLAPAKLDALNNFFAREGFAVTIPGTEVQAHIYDIDVTTPTAPIITLKPVRSTDNIGALTAGTTLSITNGAWAAGTGQPDPVTKGPIKRQYWSQIFKESAGTEGTQLANQKWYDMDSFGNDQKGYYNPAVMEMENRLAVIEDGAYLFGVDATNLSLTTTTRRNSTNTIRYTKGVIPWTRELGWTMPYTAGSFDIDDFDDMGLYMLSQGVTSDAVMTCIGQRLSNDMEAEMVSWISANSNTDFTSVKKRYFENSMDPGAKGDLNDYALDIGFSMIRKGRYTYLLKSMTNFSNPKTYGNTGYDMDQYGLALPLSQGKDAVSKTKMYNFTSKYRAYNGTSRKYVMFALAGAGNIIPGSNGVSVDDVDEIRVGVRTHHGFQGTLMNQSIMMDPS